MTENYERDSDVHGRPCDHRMDHDAVTNEPLRCYRCGKTQARIEEEEGR